MSKLIEITGKAISGEWGTDDETGTGIPVLRTTNFTNTGIINYSNVVTRDIKKKNISDKFLCNGDIIIEKSGGSDTQPVGRVVYFEGEDNKYLFNNFTGLLRIKNQNNCFPKYLFYALYSNYQNGGTLPFQNKTTGLHNLKIDDYLNSFEIPLPPLEEQKQIAATLDKVTDLIDKRRKQLEKLDELVKARFVEMFGEPIANPKRLPMIELSELGEWNSGGTPSRSHDEYFIGNIDWYSAGELNSLYLNGSVEKITQEAIANSAAKIFKAGSLLVGMYDTAAFKMGILKKDSSSNQACACIEPFDKVNVVWLYYSLQLMKDYFLEQRRGVRQKNLNLGMIRAFKIPYTEKPAQTQFADFVTQVDKQKSLTKQSLEKLETLKKSLMQEYFG